LSALSRALRRSCGLPTNERFAYTAGSP
jgi:hypothetical protein